jgi:hypothetical protein
MLTLHEGSESSPVGKDLVNKPARSDTVDLQDQSLSVDISDALSEKSVVKFTVHTKVSNIRNLILFFADTCPM